MDPIRNPFSPGAGAQPPELAGREKIIEDIRISCGRAIMGRNARSQMLLGLRGTGKTVLLNEAERIARDQDFIVSKIEAPDGDSLARLLIPKLRSVLGSLSTIQAAKQLAQRGLAALRNLAAVFNIKYEGVGVKVEPEPGLADSGDLQYDLPILFELIGRAAAASKKGWLLLIDEVQYLSKEDLSALIVALHYVSQKTLPIIIIGAGLPQVARLAGEAKSYAERLFLYPKIGALDAKAAAQAIQKPLLENEASIDPDALQMIVEDTHGYPFFLQQWGAIAWDIAEGPKITLADVELSYRETRATLDESFFTVRTDQLTKSEREFVNAMSMLGDGPYPIRDIANSLGRELKSLAPTRAKIISKGTIYSPSYGQLDFTVPLFAEFLRRHGSAL